MKWTEKEIDFLKKNYSKSFSSKWMRKHLKWRQQKSIMEKARKLGLVSQGWTFEEEKILKERYPIEGATSALAKDLGVSLSGLRHKACRNGIKFNRPNGEKSKHYKGHKEISGTFWYSIKKSAKKRNLKVLLTIEEAWNLFEKQNRLCAFTGEKLFFAPNSEDRAMGNASLDRINSKFPYTIDNVQWVTKQINWMKQDYSDQEFIKCCKKVAEYRLNS
jgi:hypothetical protein